jgi:acyl-CoA thioester hydrolase
MSESGYFFPIVDMRIKYIKPIRFNQTIRVKASLVEYLNRLKIDYIIFDSKNGDKLTTAYSIQVAALMDTGEMCFESPTILLHKLGVKTNSEMINY